MYFEGRKIEVLSMEMRMRRTYWSHRKHYRCQRRSSHRSNQIAVAVSFDATGYVHLAWPMPV